MRLTTKGRHAVTAMADLALHEQQMPVSLEDIAMRQDISLSYLGQLFMRLRAQGLVRSQRGPNGGYYLAKDSSEISIAEVIDAVDERMDIMRCGGQTNCQTGKQCLTHTLWEEVGNRIQDVFAKVCLADLVSQQTVQQVAARQDAHLARYKLSVPLESVPLEQ